jgi:hypothetical protein|nr:MAG TPA: hypothetical protein [Caudoviricetes sp.]
MKEHFGVYIVIGILCSMISYIIHHLQYNRYMKDIDNHNEYLTKELRRVQDMYYDTHDKYLKLLDNKQGTLIEGLEGVTSVSVSSLKYVELLSKEKELLELKMKLKDMQ